MYHFYKSNNATFIINCIVHVRVQCKCIRAQSRSLRPALGFNINKGAMIQNKRVNINKESQNMVLTKIGLVEKDRMGRGKHT